MIGPAGAITKGLGSDATALMSGSFNLGGYYTDVLNGIQFGITYTKMVASNLALRLTDYLTTGDIYPIQATSMDIVYTLSAPLTMTLEMISPVVVATGVTASVDITSDYTLGLVVKQSITTPLVV